MKQPSSEEITNGIGHLKEWFRSKNIIEFLKGTKAGIAIASGVCLTMGAGAVAALGIGGPSLALSLLSWGGSGIAQEALFSDLWNEIKKWIGKSKGIKELSDKEAAKYILKLPPSEIETIATGVCEKFKDDPEIKLFLTNIVKEAVLSKDFKELIGKVLADEIKKDMEAQHREILEEVRKCGVSNFYKILVESENADLDSIVKKFRRTIRLSPGEMACVIKNGETIERTLESEVYETLNDGNNALILGLSGSGKSVLLMRICYHLHLKGWKIFFTNERIDSQKTRELLGKTEGKKVLIIDNAAKYDEYFDLIENLKSDIRVVMAEQDVNWVNKNRTVKGYNFNELKLELSENEGIDYINKFGGSKTLLKKSKNIFTILTFLIAAGEESLEKLIESIWNRLNTEEKRVAYPIFVLSSLHVDYPRRLFNEIHNSPHILDGLIKKNIIDVKEQTISTIHPYLSEKIIERSTKDRFEEIINLVKKISEKKSEEAKEYYGFLFDLGYNMGMIGDETGIKEFRSFMFYPFDICSEINPEDAFAWTNKGVALEALNKHEEALKCHIKALDLNPGFFMAWHNKGASLEALNKHEEALKCFNKALDLNPEYASAWTNKGVLLETMDKHEEALKCLNKALDLNPEDAKAWTNKGVLSRLMGKHEEALKCHIKALDLNPEFEVAWTNKGVLLETMGKHEEALKCHIKALDLNPEYAKAWSNKGISLGAMGKHEEALKCFNKALDLNPEYAKAWYNKGVLLETMGKHEEALKCFNKALDLNPEYAKAWSNKGVSLDALGKHEEALKCFNKALDLNPEYAKAWSNKGVSLDALGKHEEALKCFNKALDLNPEYADALYNKGCILSLKKEKENALRCLSKAIEISEKYKELAEKDEDFKEFWDDEDFKSLQNFCSFQPFSIVSCIFNCFDN